MELIDCQTAKAQGKSKYFTGKPCKHGHIAERYVLNWTCVVCHTTKQLDVQRNWRAKHPEKSREYTAKYAPKRASQQKQYRVKNREKILITARQWRQANAGKCNAFSRKWRAENQAHMRRLHAKRRADQLARTPLWLTNDDWWLMNEIYQLAEQRTQATHVDWHVDHIIPLRGKTVSGLHVPSNLQVILATDNLRKGNCYAA